MDPRVAAFLIGMVAGLALAVCTYVSLIPSTNNNGEKP